MRRITTAVAIALLGACALGADRGHGIRVGMPVTQKRGVVCISDDFVIYSDATKGSDHCWIPNPETSVGKVTQVEKTHVVVEYATAEGWSKHVVNEASRLVWGRDYWGDPVLYRWKRDKVEFDRSDTSLLLSGEEKGAQLKLPIRVRCPVNAISVPPPNIGDVVVRGPDWNKGSADGEPGWKGRIVQSSPDDPNARSRDGYVTVEWEATKRRGRYRWDYHHKFDVISVAVGASE